jgi:hypothetical protein
VVVCRLCGGEYRAITFRHLRRVHDFDGEHPIEDYKRRFGLDISICRETQRSMRRSREDFWERHGQRWTLERVIGVLKRREREGQSLASGSLDVPLSLAIRRRFGSWERALRRAGIDPQVHRRTGRWNRRRVVLSVRERHARGETMTASYVLRDDVELYRAAIRLVGNWRTALAEAGLDPAQHRVPKKWNLAHAREWVLEAVREGRPIRPSRIPSGLYGSILKKVPGGWPAFVESLGVPYTGVRHRQDWTNEAVIQEIRRRKREGRALNRKAVQREGQAVIHQARIRFGSWDGALRAAGIDPSTIWLTHRWTRDEVLAGIRERHARGLSMSHKDAYRDTPRLVTAAQKVFPSSWRRAVKAAGLSADRASRDR